MTCHSTNVQIDDDDDTSGVHEQVDIVRVLFWLCTTLILYFATLGIIFITSLFQANLPNNTIGLADIKSL